MSRTDPEALKQFLLDNSKDANLVLSAFRELKPFFKKAETGVYDLAPASELQASEVAQAISLAINQEVKRVILISITQPFPKPEWMSQEAYGDSFETGLYNSLENDPWANPKNKLANSLRNISWSDFCFNVDAYFVNCLVDTLGNFDLPLPDKAWSSLGDSLICFIGFGLAGNQEGIERLTPLVRLLPKAIPLGEKKDEPGVWLVLVA